MRISRNCFEYVSWNSFEGGVFPSTKVIGKFLIGTAQNNNLRHIGHTVRHWRKCTINRQASLLAATELSTISNCPCSICPDKHTRRRQTPLYVIAHWMASLSQLSLSHHTSYMSPAAAPNPRASRDSERRLRPDWKLNSAETRLVQTQKTDHQNRQSVRASTWDVSRQTVAQPNKHVSEMFLICFRNVSEHCALLFQNCFKIVSNMFRSRFKYMCMGILMWESCFGDVSEMFGTSF